MGFLVEKLSCENEKAETGCLLPYPDIVATHYFSPSQKLEHGCAGDKPGMSKPFIQGISSLVMVLHILPLWRE